MSINIGISPLNGGIAPVIAPLVLISVVFIFKAVHDIFMIQDPAKAQEGREFMLGLIALIIIVLIFGTFSLGRNY